MTPQTMQAIVANLEREGLLQRQADPAHGRILRAELTERGRRVLRAAHAAAARVEAALAASLSPDEAARLAAQLARCADDLAASGS